jgi:hypothetical protein
VLEIWNLSIMDLRIINPIEFEGWDNMIAPLPGSSFFHTAAWAKVLSESYNYKPTYFTLFCDDKIVGLLPLMEVKSVLTGKRGVSLPFTDYCQPIAQNENQFQNMLHAATDFGRKHYWKYLEIRGGEDFFPNNESSEYFYGHVLDLTAGPQKIYSNLRDSTRRNIKKAQKEAVSTTISTSVQSMKEFYRLNAMTRKEHGLPPQPYSFFQHSYRDIISKKMGFIVAASYNNIAIAANVYFCFGKEVIYKYGASDKSYQNLRTNNLVMWEAIKTSCERGYEKFCFGRTEPDNKGLMQFKSGWGSEEYLIKYYKHDLMKNVFINETSIISPFYKKIFSNLPLPVLSALGRVLYRHMG